MKWERRRLGWNAESRKLGHLELTATSQPSLGWLSSLGSWGPGHAGTLGQQLPLRIISRAVNCHHVQPPALHRTWVCSARCQSAPQTPENSLYSQVWAVPPQTGARGQSWELSDPSLGLQNTPTHKDSIHNRTPSFPRDSDPPYLSPPECTQGRTLPGRLLDSRTGFLVASA